MSALAQEHEHHVLNSRTLNWHVIFNLLLFEYIVISLSRDT